MSLKDLDEKWAKNSDRTDIVVSFTTIPERINRIEQTVKSLLYQKRLPKKIYLNIPYKSYRDGTEYAIPEWLENLNALEIIRPEVDYGPSTKFIPTLEKQPDGQLILVVDDDHLYPHNFIKEFEQAHQKNNDVILAASGWRAPKDLIDKSTTLWNNIFKIPPAPVKGTKIRKLYKTDIIQGYAGYLIKPEFFNLKELKDYSEAPKELRYVDDVWISAHALVPKYIFPIKRYCYNPFFTRRFFKSTSLAKISNKGGKTDSERYNSIGLKYFEDKWKPKE